MITIDKVRDLAQHVGEDLGHSDWVIIDQPLIDKFADLTGDHMWVHQDVDRAARELPEGRTVAHGLLSFSLIPSLYYQIVHVQEYGKIFSYGCNKMRYVSPVLVGDWIRLHLRLTKVDEIKGGIMYTMEYTVEIEGSSKPAIYAEMITVAYD
ncbi:MAG: MaoC family dehydratase [Smithellaceae bacterium]